MDALRELLVTIRDGTPLDTVGNRDNDGMRDFWDGRDISKQQMAKWIALLTAAIDKT